MKRKERGWMYNRRDENNRLQDEFIKGVDEFVTFSQQHPELNDNDREKIRCPCVRCDNMKYLDVPNVKVHLYKKGFTPNYYDWFDWLCHGERVDRGKDPLPISQKTVMEKYTQNLSESQPSGSEKESNKVFFETVGDFRKGEVQGFDKGAALYYERSSRRKVRSAYPPWVFAQLTKMSERLKASERIRAELEEKFCFWEERDRRWQERQRQMEEDTKKRGEDIEQMKATMDAFMRRFGDPSSIPRCPPDDRTSDSDGF